MISNVITDPMLELFDAARDCAAAKFGVPRNRVDVACNPDSGMLDMESVAIRHYVWFLLRCTGRMTIHQIAGATWIAMSHSSVSKATTRMATRSHGSAQFDDPEWRASVLAEETGVIGAGLVSRLGDGRGVNDDAAACYMLAVECIAGFLSISISEVRTEVEDSVSGTRSDARSMVLVLMAWAGVGWRSMSQVVGGGQSGLWMAVHRFVGRDCERPRGEPIEVGISEAVDAMASQMPQDPFRALMRFRVQKTNRMRQAKREASRGAPEKKGTRIRVVDGRLVVDQSVFTEYRAACRIAGQIVGMTTADVDAGIRNGEEDLGNRRPVEDRARAIVACLLYASGVSSRDIAHFIGNAGSGVKSIAHHGARHVGYRQQINTPERRAEVLALITEGRDPAAVASLWGAA